MSAYSRRKEREVQDANFRETFVKNTQVTQVILEDYTLNPGESYNFKWEKTPFLPLVRICIGLSKRLAEHLTLSDMPEHRFARMCFLQL